MSKHTPGPWAVSPRTWSIVDADGVAFAKMLKSPTHYPDAMANARLIAAAPELLAALQKAVRYGGLFPDLKEEALAAIVKASGESK